MAFIVTECCLQFATPHTAQIQSITDESRSSIRRKNQGPVPSTNRSRPSSMVEDNQEDEVADVVNPLSPSFLDTQTCLHKAGSLATVSSAIIMV